MPTKVEALFALGNKFHDVYSFEAEIAALDQQIQLIEAAQAQQQQEQQRLQALVRERDAARNKLAATMDALVDAAAVALRVALPDGLPLDGANFIQAAGEGASLALTGLQRLLFWDSNRRMIEQRLHNRQWRGLGWAPAWVCLTLLNLPAWLLVWSGIPPYTRWMQPTLFLLLASVVSVPLAGRYECTPWSAAQHAAVAALILAVAVGQFAFYDVPFRSFDIEHLDATIAQARELAGQLQALGLLRLNYLATAVISRLQHTAAHAVVAGHSR